MRNKDDTQIIYVFFLKPAKKKLIVGDHHITFTDKRKSLSVIQIKEGLWRKLNNLKPLFNRNEELYVSKEVKENALASEGKSSVMPTKNNNPRKSICVSRPVSMKQAAKIT